MNHDETPFPSSDHVRVRSNNRVADLRDSLLRYCERLCGSEHDAEDIVQIALLKGLSEIASQEHPNELALFRRIAKHAWIDSVRKQGRLAFYDPAELPQLAEHMADETVDDLESGLEVLIQNLTEQQRAVFLLTQAFGFTNQETGDLMGLNEGSVKSLLHRARVRLQRVHQDEAESLPPNRNFEQEAQLRAYASAIRIGDIPAILRLCGLGTISCMQMAA